MAAEATEPACVCSSGCFPSLRRVHVHSVTREPSAWSSGHCSAEWGGGYGCGGSSVRQEAPPARGRIWLLHASGGECPEASSEYPRTGEGVPQVPAVS